MRFKCEECGKMGMSQQPNARFCSTNCREIVKRRRLKKRKEKD